MIQPEIKELSSISSIGIGGKALLVLVDSLPTLTKIVSFHLKEGHDYLIVGGASNLLFPDEDLTASVLRLSGEFNKTEVVGSKIKVGAGTSVASLLHISQELGLSGLEITAGLPGTVGGAVVGNAGSAQRGISELIDQLELLTSNGERLVLKGVELNPCYRDLNLGRELYGSIVTGLTLSLTPSDRDTVTLEVNRRLKSRKENQPHGRSLGCVFKNPPGDSAGRLIDRCGLKGLTQGGAIVSQKHANFILNTGNASSSDVQSLAFQIRETVKEGFGIKLALEIKILTPDARILEINCEASKS
ncbi:MAG: UDP-N-acetylmuramate dehydrogenase [Deltaproteobacteria bacterium]|nr:UDP-N-acetylmuramate dehydrogenase [Deltaproteobacteria bacterium]